jgi:alkaline phosphatase
VEGASIDKQEHPLDGPRAVYDTIEFDQAIGVAKRWAARRDDTLIVVTADHNHSMSIVGTHDRRKAAGRAGNGVYATAGFPTYVDGDGDGFPDDPNPDVQLFFGWSNHPDHTDARQHHDGRRRTTAQRCRTRVAVLIQHQPTRRDGGAVRVAQPIAARVRDPPHGAGPHPRTIALAKDRR